VMNGEVYDFTLTTKHYIAFAVIAVNFLTYFFLRPVYKYTLALTIATGLFNLMLFTALNTTTRSTFNLNGFTLTFTFQPSVFLAGLIAYVINFKRVNNYLLLQIKSLRTTEEQQKSKMAMFAERTDKFKRRYEKYPDDTLLQIINENKFVPEAIEAAQQLLNERGEN
jgi:hypothetical protein